MIITSSLRVKRSNPWRIFLDCFVALLIAMTISPTSLHAEEKKEEPVKTEQTSSPPAEKDKSFRYAPDFCDFEITFPEEPAIAKKCVPTGACYDLNSYTMVYDLQTTVDVSVNCTPSTPAAYKKYTKPVMKAALAGMIDGRDLKADDLQFHELETVRNAALTGTGVRGRQEMIYSAQIWVGPNSVFTIQAELIGSAHEKADKTFGDILQSIKVKEGKQLPKPKEYKMKGNQ